MIAPFTKVILQIRISSLFLAQDRNSVGSNGVFESRQRYIRCSYRLNIYIVDVVDPSQPRALFTSDMHECRRFRCYSDKRRRKRQQFNPVVSSDPHYKQQYRIQLRIMGSSSLAELRAEILLYRSGERLRFGGVFCWLASGASSMPTALSLVQLMFRKILVYTNFFSMD